MTLESTYSRAHRCLKKRKAKPKAGKRSLCVAHQTIADRRPS